VPIEEEEFAVYKIQFLTLPDIQEKFHGVIAALGTSTVTRLQNGCSGQIRTILFQPKYFRQVLEPT
jgi:hypothetical protein